MKIGPGLSGSVAPVWPGYPFFLDCCPGGGEGAVHVDAQDGERLAGQAIGKPDFVGDLLHAGAAPGRPEDEDDDLAAVIAQFERLAVHVSAHDLRGGLADGEFAMRGQPGLGLRADRPHIVGSAGELTSANSDRIRSYKFSASATIAFKSRRSSSSRSDLS